MPKAIQHESILNIPELGLVLDPGVALPVSEEQADALAKLGVTIIPDPATHPTED
jgi:hypothetical protein